MPGGEKEDVDSYSLSCPLADTHDRYAEAHYLLSRAIAEYHYPTPFRANLNAFIQALRSTTFILQKELHDHPYFDAWYNQSQDRMKSDPLLRAFNKGRSKIVHRGSLIANSKAEVGIFREFLPKLISPLEIDPAMPSPEVIEFGKRLYVGTFLDEEHSAIGEQIGVRRTWIAPELGEDEVVGLCDVALSRIGAVLADAHRLVNRSMEPPPERTRAMTRARVLLETDLDDSLVREWGW